MMRIFQVCRLYAAVHLFSIASICFESTHIFGEAQVNGEINAPENINQKYLNMLMPENDVTETDVIDESKLQQYESGHEGGLAGGDCLDIESCHGRDSKAKNSMKLIGVVAVVAAIAHRLFKFVGGDATAIKHLMDTTFAALTEEGKAGAATMMRAVVFAIAHRLRKFVVGITAIKQIGLLAMTAAALTEGGEGGITAGLGVAAYLISPLLPIQLAAGLKIAAGLAFIGSGAYFFKEFFGRKRDDLITTLLLGAGGIGALLAGCATLGELGMIAAGFGSFFERM